MKVLSFLFFLIAGVYAVDELHVLATVSGVQELPVPQAKIDGLNTLIKLALQGSVNASYLDATVTQTQPAGTTQQVMLDFNLNKIPAANVQSVYVILAPQLEAAKTTYGSTIAFAVGGTNLVDLKAELKPQAPTLPPTAPTTKKPTSSPTKSPTQSPTAVPTKEPTKPPTANSTSDAKQVLPAAVGIAFLLVPFLNR
mmetsp:Transcript_32396/g.63345  ORF Transcript_32396/g.63345 Transcript_32396/m.63345 type:complete len:197 (+) Transcript_32396:29-619(+)